jgi:hypothetical protein
MVIDAIRDEDMRAISIHEAVDYVTSGLDRWIMR